MRGITTPLPSVARPSWLGVLLSCLLSLTAPCDLSVVAQLFDGDGPFPLAGPTLSEAEDAQDQDDDMLRPASSKDGRRFERKLARAPLVAPDGPAAPPCPALTSLAPRAGLAGSEHARRNGVGTPLLC